MKRQFFATAKSFTLLLLATILPSILNPPPILCVPNEPHTNCRAQFNCGRFAGIGFPFWGGDRAEECGHPGLKLDCQNGTTMIEMNSVEYRVLELDLKTQLLKIARTDLSQTLCPQKLVNTTLDSDLFEYDYASSRVNLTLLYGCPAVDFPVPLRFDCVVEGAHERNCYVEFGSGITGMCDSSVVVPISDSNFFNFKRIEEMIGEGFVVRFKVESGGCSECESSGGSCGYDDAGEKFVWFCSDQSVTESTTCRAGAVADAGNYGPRASITAASVASGTHEPLPTSCLSILLTGKNRITNFNNQCVLVTQLNY